MAFIPSKYQQAIFDFIAKVGNAVISAVAGSGKTTTLVNAMALIPADKSILFLAFNRSIAKELGERIEQNKDRQVKTLHSFGMSAINRAFKGCQVDNGKYRKILQSIFSYFKGDIQFLDAYKFKADQMAMVNEIGKTITQLKMDDNQTSYISRVVKLADLGRLNLINRHNYEQGTFELYDIAEKHNVDLTNGEVHCAYYLICLGTFVTGVMDYTDMVYLPLALGLPVYGFDFVFVDECQDLNAAQRELMLKAVKRNGGRFIAVGDENQAIYGFAGADADSFQTLCNLPNTTRLPLSVSYRCGKNIIAMAKQIVPAIEAAENAKDGVVDGNASIKDIKSGDMVLCRNTFPLVALCLKYLAQGVKAFIMGSEIGDALAKMVEDTQRKTEPWSVENVFNRLYNERKKIVANVMAKERISEQEALEQSKVILYSEKIQVIELLSKGLDTPADIIDKIKGIFSDENGSGICLSTIHKSKGLEADRVFIIHPELMPSKYAKKNWEIVQENNLRYVAYTRAKSYLGFVTDFDAYADHESKEASVKEVKESGWVGNIGDKMLLELEVVSVRQVNGYSGNDTLYELRDKNGNLFSKFGVIKPTYIVSQHDEIKEGTMLRFMGTISQHNEYRGVKTTRLSTLAKAK